ncbi:hypothetical protein NQZ68_007265 [Scomber scombrus]|uniref:Uncharacterized protein n=1 Tax=Scomber scombrus TaxID=13677 RepID=A0AAV1NVE2_SCOSC
MSDATSVVNNRQVCRSTRDNMECGREQAHAAFNAWKYRLYKPLASWHRNVKLIEKPPDPPTDMTAAATTSNSTGKTSDGPSPDNQVKIDLRATVLSFI